MILSAFGFGGIVYGLSQIGGAAAHTSGAAEEAAGAASTMALIVSLSVGVVALGLFIWRQLRLQKVDDALLDLRVFRSGNFSLSIAQMLLLSIAFFGAITVIPLYMQNVLQVSAFQTGLVVLPGALVMGLTGPFIGRIYDRWGTRVLLVPGSIIASALLWVFTTFDETTPVWMVAIAQTAAVARSRDVVHAAVHGIPRIPRAQVLLVRIRGDRHRAAGRGSRRASPCSSRCTRPCRPTPPPPEPLEVAANAAGAHAAFLIAAIVSLPLIVGRLLHPQAGRGAVRRAVGALSRTARCPATASARTQRRASAKLSGRGPARRADPRGGSHDRHSTHARRGGRPRRRDVPEGPARRRVRLRPHPDDGHQPRGASGVRGADPRDRPLDRGAHLRAGDPGGGARHPVAALPARPRPQDAARRRAHRGAARAGRARLRGARASRRRMSP